MTDLGNTYQLIRQYIERRMANTGMPGLALAITDREKTLHVTTFGYGDLSSREPVHPGMMFEIGSIGKSFTNIALMQLRDEGRLELDAPVSEFLPWFEVKSRFKPITAHHLMTHTSGLPAGTDIGTHGLYEAWALRHCQTEVAPGEYFRYSNVGYKVLGFLLEELDGRPYADAIQARVLDPLGMENSHPVIGHETRKRAAVGHRPFYDDRPEHRNHGMAPALWTEYGVGDGCQASTAEDMCIYLRMLMNEGVGPSGRVMSAESFALMSHRVVETQQWGGAWYGYGLTTADVDGHTYLGHGGGTTGFVSAMIADLDEGFGVNLLINGISPSFGAVPMALHILSLLRADTGLQSISSSPPGPDTNMVRDAEAYAGTYSSATDRMVVTADGGRLLLDWRGDEIALEQRDEDTFYAPHPDLELFLLEFGRNEERVAEIFHGQDRYVSGEAPGSDDPGCPNEWEAYLGHYRTYNFGLTNFRIVSRKGRLLLIYPPGWHDVLTPISDGSFRIGDDPRSPETISFDSLASGKALRVVYSGCPYYRTYTP